MQFAEWASMSATKGEMSALHKKVGISDEN